MVVNGIHIRNVYHMLSYAFCALREGVYANVAAEEFEHCEDLFGQILALGIGHLLKQGLHREYEEEAEDLLSLRGKIDLVGTMRHKLSNRQTVHCIHDEYSANNLFNQILKSTSCALLRTGRLSRSGADLKRALAFFKDVDEVELKYIRWGDLRYHRNNRHYLMLMNICKFVVDGMLLGEADAEGDKRIRTMEIDEGKMAKLFEVFVREYFAWHYDLHSASKQIAWDVPQDTDTSLLPNMLSDIMLSDGDKTLIIDTKFYGKIMQEHWDAKSVRNMHLYQILAYVNNQKAMDLGKTVAGMLLYAKTSEDAPQPVVWQIGGNGIAIQTLDLAQPFSEISGQLDGIVKEHFNVKKRA